MPRARATSRLVVLLLVPRDIAKAHKRFTENGDAALPLRTGCGYDIDIAPVELRGKLELITARSVWRCCCISRHDGWCRLLVLEGHAQRGEGSLGLIEVEMSTDTQDELCPELLLFSEELAEALEKLAILDSTWRVIGLLSLPRGMLDGTV